MRQRLEESTTEAQTLLSGYLRARVEMAELRPHASDVVARMLLYTVVSGGSPMFPSPSSATPSRCCCPAWCWNRPPGAAFQRGGTRQRRREVDRPRRERAWRPKCFGVSSDADKLAGHVVGVGKNHRSCRRWCLQPSLPPTA
jgi:hypothetical protein